MLIKMKPVLIRGDGVAAYCCAHLLERAGVRVTMDRPERARLPAIMLSEAAVRMMAEVFGRPDLFGDLPRIASRSVLWGANAITLPHSAVVVSEQVLLDALRPDGVSAGLDEPSEWTLHASRPLPEGSREEGFGSRVAYTAAVELNDAAGPGCWTESLEEGWLFMIGGGDGKGWLLSVGGAVDDALGRSRLIANAIERLGKTGGRFPAFPRIISPLGDAPATSPAAPWLACGSAAMAFDPLCGDGTAHAVREAILAAAVIRAALSGAPAKDVMAHYEARLTLGFQRHLSECARFYQSGGGGKWWREELSATERGLSWCATKMSSFPGFHFRLNGYQLEAIR